MNYKSIRTEINCILHYYVDYITLQKSTLGPFQELDKSAKERDQRRNKHKEKHKKKKKKKKQQYRSESEESDSDSDIEYFD